MNGGLDDAGVGAGAGAGPGRPAGSGPGPAPVASLDELAGGEPGSGAPTARTAAFDAGHLGATRPDVPVADLGLGASPRPGRRLRAVELDTAGARAAPAQVADVDQVSEGRKPRGRQNLSVAGAGGGEVRSGEKAGEHGDGGAKPRGPRRRDQVRPDTASPAAVEADSIGGTGRGPGREPARNRGEGPEPDPEADPLSVARTICLRLLTERGRSRYELAEALRRKGVPENAARAVLERLGEVGLIDDTAFAEQWVHSRHTGKGLGRRALAVELRRKGVADDVAGDALGELDSDAEERRARELVDRKLRGMVLDSPGQRAGAARRVAGMLARKGYGAGIAYRVVREAITARAADTDEEFDPADGIDD